MPFLHNGSLAGSFRVDYDARLIKLNWTADARQIPSTNVDLPLVLIDPEERLL